MVNYRKASGGQRRYLTNSKLRSLTLGSRRGNGADRRHTTLLVLLMEESVSDNKQNMAKSTPALRLAQTSSVFLAIFTLGFVSAVLGAALIDLSQLFNASVELTSQILTTRAIGLLAGSLLSSSVLYRFVNGKLCIISAMLIGGLANAIIPDVGHIEAAHVCLFVAGATVGVLEVGGNVWLVQLWKDKVAPVFQMYHLSFGIGALLAPVITEPFLSSKNELISANATAEPLGEVVGYTESRVAIPFAIFGGAYASVGALMLCLFCVDSSDLQQQEKSSTSSSPAKSESDPKDDQCDAKPRPRAIFEWTVVVHLVLYIFVQVAIEATIAQMLSVYVVSNVELNFDKSSAAFLLSVFWALYTAGRLTAMVLSFRVQPFHIIASMHGLCIVGSLLLLALGISSGASLWASMAILGFGLSPLYASAMSWAVRYVRLRFVHMTLVLVASCLGQMAPPLTVALWINATPAIFVYVISGWMVLHTVNLVVMRRNTAGQPEIFAAEAAEDSPSTKISLKLSEQDELRSEKPHDERG